MNLFDALCKRWTIRPWTYSILYCKDELWNQLFSVGNTFKQWLTLSPPEDKSLKPCRSYSEDHKFWMKRKSKRQESSKLKKRKTELWNFNPICFTSPTLQGTRSRPLWVPFLFGNSSISHPLSFWQICSKLRERSKSLASCTHKGDRSKNLWTYCKMFSRGGTWTSF